MKKVIILLLLASFTFTFSVSAQSNVGNLAVDNSVEEKVIEIDLSDVVIREVMNLTANYEDDYNDLLNQFLEQSEEYNNVQSILNDKEISIDKQTELENRKESLLSKFKSNVDSLLQTRYTDDKKSLRLEIAEKSEFMTLASDQYFYKTWDTGTVGVTDKTGSISNAWYNHHKNYNRSYAYVQTTLQAATATVRNGITIASLYEERADINFRQVTVGAYLSCLGPNSIAQLEVDAIIYNGFTNQLIISHDFLHSICNTNEGTLSVDIAPHKISFTNVPLIAGPMQIYLTTRAEAAMSGSKVDAGELQGGVKWGQIEITKR